MVDRWNEPREHGEHVLTVLGETRAMRHLRSEPVPDHLVDRLLWAATRASSPNNSQLWHFVVVRDTTQRKRMAAALQRFREWMDRISPPEDPAERQTYDGARHLLDSIAAAPVLIVVCGENAYPPGAPDPTYLWATLGGAGQNLLVAARALGLGATLTMFHVLDEQAVADVLGLPPGVRIGSIVPLGWPARSFGPVRRRPMREVVHHERW